MYFGCDIFVICRWWRWWLLYMCAANVLISVRMLPQNECGERDRKREREQKARAAKRYKRLYSTHNPCGNTCRNLLDESGLRHSHFNKACCFLLLLLTPPLPLADARINSSVWKCVQQKKNILIGKCDWESRDRVCQTSKNKQTHTHSICCPFRCCAITATTVIATTLAE